MNNFQKRGSGEHQMFTPELACPLSNASLVWIYKARDNSLMDLQSMAVLRTSGHVICGYEQDLDKIKMATVLQWYNFLEYWEKLDLASFVLFHDMFKFNMLFFNK